MADIRQVEVIFRAEEYSGAQKPNQKTRQSKKGNKVKDRAAQHAANVVVQQTWSFVKSEVRKVVNYEINKWFTIKDDYIAQRSLTNAMNVISKTKDITVAIAGGFVAAGAAGATVLAIGSLVSLGIDIAQNYDQQNLKLKQMEAQLKYQRDRVGYSLTSGRIGENR